MRKKVPELKSMELAATFTCTACNEEQVTVHVPRDYVSADIYACDLCGDHGSISIDVTCGHCGFTHCVEIGSW